MTLMKDIAMFDGLYDKNLEYFKQLQLYIQAGEEKIQELNQTTIPKLEAQAQVSDNPMAVQVVQDFKDAVSRFEKKVHDLKISKTIAIQTAPQIRIIQNNDKILVDRIQSAIYNTIPLWKNQMVLALGLGRQKKPWKCSRPFPIRRMNSSSAMRPCSSRTPTIRLLKMNGPSSTSKRSNRSTKI